MSFNESIGNLKKITLRFIDDHSLSVLTVSGAALVLLLTALIGRACYSSPAEKYFPRNQADFLPLKTIDRKLAFLERKQEKNPEDLSILFAIAQLKFQKGISFYPESIIALEKTKSGGYLDSRVFYYLGYMYQQEGLNSYAEKEYKRFLYNHPGDYDALMLLGRALYSQEKYKEAASVYQALLKKHKKDKILIANSIFAFWKSGYPYHDSLESLAKRGREGSYLALCVEGEILYEEGRYQESLQRLNLAKQMQLSSDSDIKIDILIAKSFLSSSDIISAKNIVIPLIKTNPDNKELKIIADKILNFEKKNMKKNNIRKKRGK